MQSQICFRSFCVGAVCLFVFKDVVELCLDGAEKHKKRSPFARALSFLVSPIRGLVGCLWGRESNDVGNGAFWDLVGNTPLVRIASLSNELGVTVLGKAEFLNPGGSVKDRVAKQMILDAERNGRLKKTGDRVFEGTSGSTGISLTLASNCRGYKSSIFLPDDQAEEKKSSLRVLGAEVTELPPSSITDPNHYVNAARKASELLDTKSGGGTLGFFADQFENLSNFRAHYEGTAVEILKQTRTTGVDFFVASSGTGGTIAGTATRLKEANPSMKVILADPQGSGLYGKIRHGVLFNPKDKEGHRTRRVCDTIVEGVGINRLSANLVQGIENIDYAYRASDSEVVRMSRYLIAHDGLFVGSSSALNCCAIVKAVKDGIIRPGSTVVVILCDSGFRHLSRFYNCSFLESQDLLPPNEIPPQSVFDFID